MDFKLTGQVDKKNSMGIASNRIRRCQKALKPHGIVFPPFVHGTLNIALDNEFLTPNWPGIIFVSDRKLRRCDSGWSKEWWKLIPVKKVNGAKMPAYILRTEANVHKNKVVELIAHKINLQHGAMVEIVVSDNN